MIKVGITGGIGSGKSIVCRVFQQLGVVVYRSDEEAKKLYEESTVKKQVRKLFGKHIIDGSGNIDKKKLAAIVFRDPVLLKRLNEIIHPAVKEHFRQWLASHKKEKYILKEAAILFESGTNKGLDYIITVSAPVELRIRRTMERDGVEEAVVLSRIKTQMSEDEKIKRADFVIVNDETQLIIPQVLKIHQTIVKSTFTPQ